MTQEPAVVFFSGIGGIGMSALAQLLHDRGDMVLGSDRSESPVTDLLAEKGITVIIGQTEENITPEITLFVYSAAVGEDNPERVRARKLDIPELSYFEMLGRVSEAKRTIAVAGTHGKTTTTAMLARILTDCNLDPTAVVGSIVRDFGSNYLPGASDLFVVEACEYKSHFLTLSPEVLVITNLEFDHTDFFSDLKDVQNAFRALIAKVPAHGAIITDPEHPHIAPLLGGIAAQVINYTREPSYPLQMPGEFNEMNARAAAAAARVLVPTLQTEDLIHSLSTFEGTWRRFEKKGETSNGVMVYDDYAHHPTAIRETLRALRAKTEGNVFVAFHPHLYSRTRDLFDGFVRAFADADQVLIAPIFGAREIDDGSISSELLAEAIRKEGIDAYAHSFEEIERILREKPQAGDVIMTMGAGDIYKVADALVQ